MFESFYDDTENAKVDFFGYASELARYDFAIVYTNRFFGKPLVVCMQTGRSSLLDPDDLKDTEGLQKTFAIKKAEEAEELATILKVRLPLMEFKEQY